MKDIQNHIKKLSVDDLKIKANNIRKDMVEICIKNGAGHIAPSLSSIDILVALYYSVMNVEKDPKSHSRDRLIFSKAHGCYGLYAILSDIGFINRKDWENFYNGSFLPGCIERSLEHGIEAGTGSLGHGLPIATGISFGGKLQKNDFVTYCVVGDGELQEGSNWEAFQFAVKHKLSNLVVIIDNNGLQAMDFLENVLTPAGLKNDLENKCKGFGLEVRTCDGHNMDEIIDNLNQININRLKSDSPQVLIANTVKGYGLNCMENIPKFHFRLPTDDELDQGKRYE